MNLSSSSSVDIDSIYEKMPKIKTEFFSLTYGAIVAQIIRDYEDSDDVNQMLYRMGQYIGLRLVDEFFAKTHLRGTTSLKEIGDCIAKVYYHLILYILVNLNFVLHLSMASKCF